ncbi:MAG: hypothetical protein M1830_002300 [Pleopsidium flavum]|nr:MAG: hypothetical protein M1830_002300 [Pleopsidium flavum]
MTVYLYIALGILVVHISWTIIYNIFFHPLRNIQDTFLMKLTDYWLLLIGLAGWRAITVHHLHQKYGSVIRIAPNELVFSSAKAAQQIYGQTSDFIKVPLYKELGRHALCTMQDNDEHKERRKLLAPAFSTSSFLDSEPLIHNSVRELLKIIKKRDEKPLDVFFWFKMLSLDIAGDLLFGKAFRALKEETTPGYVYDFDTTF